MKLKPNDGFRYFETALLNNIEFLEGVDLFSNTFDLKITQFNGAVSNILQVKTYTLEGKLVKTFCISMTSSRLLRLLKLVEWCTGKEGKNIGDWSINNYETICRDLPNCTEYVCSFKYNKSPFEYIKESRL